MTAQNGSFSAHGQTAKNNTFATFIRLGDT